MGNQINMYQTPIGVKSFVGTNPASPAQFVGSYKIVLD